MPYDRTKLIKYARDYWKIPCDDGTFWLHDRAVHIDEQRKRLSCPKSEGWEPVFVPDGNGGEDAVFQKKKADGTVVDTRVMYYWKELDDCTHFSGWCLHKGGINLPVVNHKPEIYAPKLIVDLQRRHDTKTLAEKVDQDHGQQVVDSGILKPADVIGYFTPSKGRYTHSAIFVGSEEDADGGIACHTICRYPGLSDDSVWHLNDDGLRYTFIHVSSGDKNVNPRLDAVLAGGWEVTSNGGKEYYDVQESKHVGGRAFHATLLPSGKSWKERLLPHPDSSAYWFPDDADPDTITFIWKRTGDVEVWKRSAPREFDRTVNGNALGQAAKLF
jgi:hypothetical protein